MELAPLTDKQAATIRLARSSRIAVWEGSVRSGKTIVSLIAWIDFLLSAPPGPLLMAGRTIDTLRRNVFDPLTELVGSENLKATWGDGRATILDRDVHLVGADNKSAESRIRGLTLAGAYVDELTILGGPNGQEWWQMLLTRMSVRGARVLATTNPGSPSHWLLEDYLERAAVTVTSDSRVDRQPEYADAAIHRYRFTLDDNTTLPPEYVTALKASLTGLFYKRFIDGLWVAAEGAVYPTLEPATVTGTPPEQLYKPTIGIDHGTTNPTHAVLTGVDEDGAVWVVDECRLTDPLLTPDQQAAALVQWMSDANAPHDTTVVIDPAAKGFRNAWRAAAGRWPREADNRVLPGITDVATLIGQGRIRFADGKTPHLIRELIGYAWDPKAQERGVDAPVKKNDHGPDALRYAVRSLRVTARPS